MSLETILTFQLRYYLHVMKVLVFNYNILYTSSISTYYILKTIKLYEFKNHKNIIQNIFK
jgi:hypothetical protein